MKITIKEKEIELRQSVRALMLYENVEGKSFSPQSTTDIITFLYCVVVSSSKDYTISFDDVLDWVDENPTMIGEFSQWLVSGDQNQNKLKKD